MEGLIRRGDRQQSLSVMFSPAGFRLASVADLSVLATKLFPLQLRAEGSLLQDALLFIRARESSSDMKYAS